MKHKADALHPGDCKPSSSTITAARILPTILAFLAHRGPWHTISCTSISCALVSTGLDAFWLAGHISGHLDRHSEPRSQSTSGLCSCSQSRPMITSDVQGWARLKYLGSGLALGGSGSHKPQAGPWVGAQARLGSARAQARAFGLWQAFKTF